MNRLRIINFHEVTNSKWFHNSIELLKEKYILIGTDELIDLFQSKKFNKNYCHLTIDDGHITFYNNVFPVLKKLNIQASLFVSPKICMEEKNFWFQEIVDFDSEKFKVIIANYMKVDLKIIDKLSIFSILKALKLWQIKELINIYIKKYQISLPKFQNITLKQLLEIHNSGLINVGAHTLNHPILANEDDTNCFFEITSSIKQLSDILNKEIDIFAYPNGIPVLDFGEREIRVVKENNIKLAFSDVPGSISGKMDLFSIKRFGISYGNRNFIKTKLILGPFWNRIKDIIIGGEEIERLKLKEHKQFQFKSE